MWESWPGVETCCIPPSSKGIIPCVEGQVEVQRESPGSEGAEPSPLPNGSS